MKSCAEHRYVVFVCQVLTQSNLPNLTVVEFEEHEVFQHTLANRQWQWQCPCQWTWTSHLRQSSPPNQWISIQGSAAFPGNYQHGASSPGKNRKQKSIHRLFQHKRTDFHSRLCLLHWQTDQSFIRFIQPSCSTAPRQDDHSSPRAGPLEFHKPDDREVGQDEWSQSFPAHDGISLDRNTLPEENSRPGVSPTRTPQRPFGQMAIRDNRSRIFRIEVEVTVRRQMVAEWVTWRCQSCPDNLSTPTRTRANHLEMGASRLSN